ncbi:MAG: hypothetical protein JW990_12175 [Thermoleophilia bacterium]|nr:hypothetical protein [Thermoleophilia bacterium]
MKRARYERPFLLGPQHGSIVMLVLFMCLAIAVVVQTLVVAVICSTRALGDEIAGRARMEEKDAGLAALRDRALIAWGAVPWMVVSEDGHTVEGCLTEVADETEWVLAATVRQESGVSRLTTSALLERGHDGVDLPLAAVVAGSMTASEGRSTVWLEAEEETEAVAYVTEPPVAPLFGERCSAVRLTDPWRLDPGWATLFGEDASEGMAPGPGAIVLTGWPGITVGVPVGGTGGTVDDLALVVVTGGAGLDARGLGDLYGVIVVDEGSVYLDGTALHGAVFATDAVDLGETGRVVFSRSILRWATDRSLVRTRLVPGSRGEGQE